MDKDIKEELTKKAKKDSFSEYYPYFIIIFFIIIIRTFIATPVRVNGESMYPTLHDKDIMLLYKLEKTVKGINRFDIVVIQTDDGKLIKRVVGMPGDKIKYRIMKDEEGVERGVLYINGEEVQEDFILDDVKLNTCRSEWKLCKEEITIPENEYYVLGDNRGSSKDSRIIGSIKENKILGKARVILFPFNRFGNVK